MNEPFIFIPSDHVLILRQPKELEQIGAIELSEIAQNIKERLSIEVMFISGWEIVGAMQKVKNHD